MEAYEWHRWGSTCINGEDYPLSLYLETIIRALAQPGARSWGVLQEGELVGMVLFEPIWRSQELVDGSCHIVLARRAWGRKTLQEVCPHLVQEMFTSTPSLLRLSGFTPSHYRPGLTVAEALGFKVCGVLEDAVWIRGKVRNLTITGLTRQQWEKSQIGGE